VSTYYGGQRGEGGVTTYSNAPKKYLVEISGDLQKKILEGRVLDIGML